jgi:hypothetical protein
MQQVGNGPVRALIRELVRSERITDQKEEHLRLASQGGI